MPYHTFINRTYLDFISDLCFPDFFHRSRSEIFHFFLEGRGGGTCTLFKVVIHIAEWGRTFRVFFCVSRLSVHSDGLFVLLDLTNIIKLESGEKKKS